MLRTKTGRGAIVLVACAVAAVVLAAPASAKTHKVSGKQIVVDEEKGIYKMRGSLRGAWNITSFEELDDSPYFHAQGHRALRGLPRP